MASDDVKIFYWGSLQYYLQFGVVNLPPQLIQSKEALAGKNAAACVGKMGGAIILS